MMSIKMDNGQNNKNQTPRLLMHQRSQQLLTPTPLSQPLSQPPSQLQSQLQNPTKKKVQPPPPIARPPQLNAKMARTSRATLLISPASVLLPQEKMMKNQNGTTRRISLKKMALMMKEKLWKIKEMLLMKNQLTKNDSLIVSFIKQLFSCSHIHPSLLISFYNMSPYHKLVMPQQCLRLLLKSSKYNRMLSEFQVCGYWMETIIHKIRLKIKRNSNLIIYHLSNLYLYLYLILYTGYWILDTPVNLVLILVVFIILMLQGLIVFNYKTIVQSITQDLDPLWNQLQQNIIHKNNQYFVYIIKFLLQCSNLVNHKPQLKSQYMQYNKKPFSLSSSLQPVQRENEQKIKLFISLSQEPIPDIINDSQGGETQGNSNIYSHFKFYFNDDQLNISVRDQTGDYVSLLHHQQFQVSIAHAFKSWKTNQKATKHNETKEQNQGNLRNVSPVIYNNFIAFIEYWVKNTPNLLIKYTVYDQLLKQCVQNFYANKIYEVAFSLTQSKRPFKLQEQNKKNNKKVVSVPDYMSIDSLQVQKRLNIYFTHFSKMHGLPSGPTYSNGSKTFDQIGKSYSTINLQQWIHFVKSFNFDKIFQEVHKKRNKQNQQKMGVQPGRSNTKNYLPVKNVKWNSSLHYFKNLFQKLSDSSKQLDFEAFITIIRKLFQEIFSAQPQSLECVTQPLKMDKNVVRSYTQYEKIGIQHLKLKNQQQFKTKLRSLGIFVSQVPTVIQNPSKSHHYDKVKPKYLKLPSLPLMSVQKLQKGKHNKDQLNDLALPAVKGNKTVKYYTISQLMAKKQQQLQEQIQNIGQSRVNRKEQKTKQKMNIRKEYMGKSKIRPQNEQKQNKKLEKRDLYNLQKSIVKQNKLNPKQKERDKLNSRTDRKQVPHEQNKKSLIQQLQQQIQQQDEYLQMYNKGSHSRANNNNSDNNKKSTGNSYYTANIKGYGYGSSTANSSSNGNNTGIIKRLDDRMERVNRNRKML